MRRFAFVLLGTMTLAPLAQAQPVEPPPGEPAPTGEPPVPPTPPAPVPPPPPAPAPAVAVAQQSSSNFMDTRLTFTCADEDMLRDPTVLPFAPGFHCGTPNSLGILFFDAYDTRFSGFETMSNLALYKHYKNGPWDIEGGFIVRINEFAEDNIRMADGGSYMRLAYSLDDKGDDRIALIAFPVSSDRMRLGYSYKISWGGSPEFFKANPDVPNSSGKNANSVPGAKLQLTMGNVYAYVGVKSTLLLNPLTNELEGVLSFLGGAGVDVTPMLRIEANGGYFDRGKNEAEDVLGKPVVLYGASAQVALHDGMPVGSSIDYALYRNEPESIARLFAPESYPGGLSWLAMAEFTLIAQTLKDPSAAGSTVTQTGYAGDLNLRVKYDLWRIHADLMTRDLGFILHSIPSLPTYWDFPTSYSSTTEIFAALGVDRKVPEYAFTAGLTVGLDMPATLTTPNSTDIPGNMTTSTTLVIRNESNRTVLPVGSSVAPIFAVKGTVRKEFGPNFAAVADLYYQYDPNTVRYDRSSNQGSFNQATFASFDQLGFDITIQARF